jgi:prepilin-type N-terminal cleavage/methylation domain-containing protein
MIPSEVKDGRGFTLIELAVTLLVLAVAAAVVVPGIGRSIESVRARAEVSGFAAYLRAAREQAIVRGEAQAVRLNPETRSLAITAAGSDAVRSSRSFAYLVRIEPEPPEALPLTFEPLGFSSGATYRILAPGNRHYLISVDPLTGRVSSRLADS